MGGGNKIYSFNLHVKFKTENKNRQRLSYVFFFIKSDYILFIEKRIMCGFKWAHFNAIRCFRCFRCFKKKLIYT